MLRAASGRTGTEYHQPAEAGGRSARVRRAARERPQLILLARVIQRRVERTGAGTQQAAVVLGRPRPQRHPVQPDAATGARCPAGTTARSAPELEDGRIG